MSGDWTQAVEDVYQDALAELEGSESPLHFGPAHIVWDDHNLDDDDIRFCLNECDFRRRDYDLSDRNLAIVRRSLVNLLAIPESQRFADAGSDDSLADSQPSTV